MTWPKRVARASAGGVVAGPLLAASVLAPASPTDVVLASAAVIAVAAIQIVGSQLTKLLWTAAYSRMLAAVARAGIAHAQDSADIHHLMSDLCRAQASMQLRDAGPGGHRGNVHGDGV